MFSETTFLMVFGLGAACMLLGFFLVVRGVGASDGESAIKLIGIEIRASKVGPGVLFALFGLVLVVTAIAKLQGPSGEPKAASSAAPVEAAPVPQPVASPESVERGDADNLIGALSRHNLHSSMGDAALRDWLDGDSHYRRLAQATLAALGERKLTAAGADILKVNYLYLQQMGVQDEAQLPAGQGIDPAALQRALVLAHRDMNGGSAATLSDIAH